MSIKLIEMAVRFTDTYKEYYNAHPAIREVMCQAASQPECLAPLEPDDTFAGFMWHRVNNKLPVLFTCEHKAQIGYSMNTNVLRKLQKEHPEYAEVIEDLINFWRKESTFVKIRREAPYEVRNYLFPHGAKLDSEDYMRTGSDERPLGSGFISGSYDSRVAGLMLDYGKLIRLGIPGLREEIESASQKNPRKADFYKAAQKALDIICDCCRHYRKQAHDLGLSECEEILSVLPNRAPQTLREGIQLILIYTSVTSQTNLGRLDVTLGDLLAKDLAEGRLTEESAVELLCEYWKKFEKWCSEFTGRILLGGKERPNEENADKFALLAMEATRRRHAILPVLTLRLTKGQNPALLDKAMETIGEGCIYPTLYNDDAYIPGCMKGMNLPYEDAVKYAPLGCGEIDLECASVGSPNSTMRFLKALEAALHNGCDAITGELIGVETGVPEDFDSYEKLEAALYTQIREALERDVKVHVWNRKITARETAYVLESILMDDCIERGLGLHAGGVRYFGGNVEGFGQTNTANSLYVIKKLVYEEKRYTLRQVVNILDADFEGYEDDRKLFISVEKYGNNCPEVDDIRYRLEKYINDTAREIGEEAGLDYYTVASVNPGGITIGPRVAASADGRRCGEPMALGNSPQPGTDVSGLTAMLLSATKTDPANGGVVTNMNMSRKTIVENREQVKNAFLTYFDMGGLQLNINCFSKGDLEKALENPQEYRNIIVRVSGYSARFIDLDSITQKAIMARTLY